MFDLIPLLIAIPLAGMLLNMFFGRRLGDPLAGVLASCAAGLSFVIALLQFVALLAQPQGTVVTLAQWIAVDDLNVAWAFQIDTLSVTMMLVVTGIGTLIHIYAIAYMRGDEGFARFFVYMNLFLASMLLLVTANSYLMMFVGWELVGLCSYLLIGFWFDQGKDGTGNARAGRKAFIVNRIGDVGFILAMILIFSTFGTLTFDEVFAQAEVTLSVGAPVALAITLLLLLGATGKSAQIPLFVWLPDAMAGPTPVSALIHAATMVTAGIYLIVRSHVLFALAPVTQLIVVLIGAATALLAATIAIAQFDIKRVLAYSTISQLGFMIAAVGLGAYVAAMFHLITHAFFKALLFLSAGSIIHGMQHGREHSNDELSADALQDIRSMGGLRTKMPVTFWVYVIGALALAGIPPLAGFFSKDEILADAFAHNPTAYVLLALAATCTALYMARQVLAIFFGASRTQAAMHARENRPLMTLPLIILAALSIMGGAINLPQVHSLGDWLGLTLGEIEALGFNAALAVISTILALLSFAIAYAMYGRQPACIADADPLARLFPRMFTLFNRGWWIDEAYHVAIVRPFNRLSVFVARVDVAASSASDRAVIALTQSAASILQKTQTGQLNWNAFGLVCGLIIILLLVAASG